jgi:RimJ/RimL family protein N-acetyltransferase
LRPVRRTDIEYFLKWFNDPEVIQYISLYLPMTEMAEEKFIEELGTTRAKTDAVFVIETIDNDKTIPIGSTDLGWINNKDHNAVFGIAIGEKEYWSKGYGTEASRLIIEYGFDQLNLHMISSGAYAFNERSIRMHKRLGFREEGRRKEVNYINGAYHDHVMFGLLRREWKEMVNS